MGSTYKMYDSDPKGMFRINIADARAANAEGFGIFQTVNTFRGERKIANLVSIDAWAVDIDDGTKDEQWAKIRTGLIPTLVVETKRGFQLWFKAISANPVHWNSMVLDRLVPFYGADKNARDIARVLRVPGYYHLKDPNDPFLVKAIAQTRSQYTERDIAGFYPDKSEPMRTEFKARAVRDAGGTEGLWEAVWRLDCGDALSRLSGSPEIGGEVISFRQTSAGKHNIFVNGKGTSCWVDADGRIGSLDKGGPTIAQWIRWYGHSWPQTVEILRKHFPELPWNK